MLIINQAEFLTFTFNELTSQEVTQKAESWKVFFFPPEKELIAHHPAGKYVGQRCRSFHFSQKDKHFPHKRKCQRATLKPVERSQYFSGDLLLKLLHKGASMLLPHNVETVKI